MLGDHEPEDVFTPRKSDVNERMYIERPSLEQSLERALRGTQHIIVHGESGTGKSWLYKRVFTKNGVHFQVANLANANRLGSITKEIENVIRRDGKAYVTGYSESKNAKVSAILAEGKVEHEKQYTYGSQEPFEECLAKVRADAGSKTAAVLVLDNLETIFDSPERMSELADLIILLDDERYAQYRVKLLLVGVPHQVREYFNRTPNRGPVANRLAELPEVSRLDDNAANVFVYRGFVEELKYAFGVNLPLLEKRNPRTLVTEHVAWVTDRIPQRLHEYCLELALVARDNAKTVTPELLDIADKRWLSANLSQTYTVVENAMNVRETKVGRRNQTIYAIGQLRQNEFRLGEVEDIVRTEFPSSTSAKTLNISGMLADLASGDDPILRRAPRGDAYMFSDPLYRMCIRAMLRKRDEEVIKLEVSSV